MATNEIPESQLVREWMAAARRQGAVKGARDALLRVLDLRFPGRVSAELRSAITKEDNLERLNEWITASIKAVSIATFSPLVLPGESGSMKDSLDCAAPFIVDAASAKRQAERGIP